MKEKYKGPTFYHKWLKGDLNGTSIGTHIPINCAVQMLQEYDKLKDIGPHSKLAYMMESIRSVLRRA